MLILLFTKGKVLPILSSSTACQATPTNQTESMKNTVISAILDRLAGLYDLPEIRRAVDQLVEGNEEQATKIVSTVCPKGQLAAIVQSLEVSVGLEKDLSLSSKFKSVYHVRLDYSYKHVGGGSNGKSVYFYALADISYGGAREELTALMEKHAFDELFRIVDRKMNAQA